MSSSAGLALQDKGVFLIASNPFFTSVLVAMHFLIIVFTVFTADSARPLEREYLGEEVVWVNSHCFENCLNVLDLYWLPLSDTSSEGIP